MYYSFVGSFLGVVSVFLHGANQGRHDANLYFLRKKNSPMFFVDASACLQLRDTRAKERSEGVGERRHRPDYRLGVVVLGEQ